MVFPRALAIVRGQESISQTMDASPAAAHVRESAGLYALLTNQLATRTNRVTAMQIPAFVDALKTYTHTISAFPLREYRFDQPVAIRPFLQMPSRIYPYASVIQRTLSDLLMYDRAYWLVTERTFDGYPVSIEVMRVEDVIDTPSVFVGIAENYQPPADPFYYLARQVPTRDVIKFYGSGEGGWLANGATAISTAASLEAATLMYSETPIPTVALKNSGPDLPAEQVDALLMAWEEARANRGTAYLNNTIDAQVMGFSARDVQLVEAKNMAAVAIARLANLDPVWVGAGIPGSSLTYANRTDLYRGLLDTALRPIMSLFEQRLSMPDVTPPGQVIKFDTTAFLRANPVELADLITKLLPLGVLTQEEAKMVLDLPTLGVFSMTTGVTR
jgi:hypothetical protein